jgi:hypothetical protein
MESTVFVHSILLGRKQRTKTVEMEKQRAREGLWFCDHALWTRQGIELSSRGLLYLLILHKGMLVDGLHNISEENF